MKYRTSNRLLKFVWFLTGCPETHQLTRFLAGIEGSRHCVLYACHIEVHFELSFKMGMEDNDLYVFVSIFSRLMRCLAQLCDLASLMPAQTPQRLLSFQQRAAPSHCQANHCSCSGLRSLRVACCTWRRSGLSTGKKPLQFQS